MEDKAQDPSKILYALVRYDEQECSRIVALSYEAIKAHYPNKDYTITLGSQLIPAPLSLCEPHQLNVLSASSGDIGIGSIVTQSEMYPARDASDNWFYGLTGTVVAMGERDVMLAMWEAVAWDLNVEHLYMDYPKIANWFVDLG